MVLHPCQDFLKNKKSCHHKTYGYKIRYKDNRKTS